MRKKKCLHCKNLFPDTLKYFYRCGIYGLDRICKQCARDKQKSYWRKHKDKARDSQLRYNYGISLATWNELFKKQKGRCTICSRNQSKLKRELVTDHDHITGKVRGLLCRDCNRNLGWYEKYRNKIMEYLNG